MYIKKQKDGGIVAVGNLISGLKYENCIKLRYLFCNVFVEGIFRTLFIAIGVLISQRVLCHILF